MEINEKSELYLCNTYARNLTLDHGKGSELWDCDGKRYIDFSSGIAVNSFGVSDQLWANAITAQAQKLQHTSNLYYSAPAANLAEQLCLRTGMSKVFFSNSGCEANECAIKVARKHSFDKYGAGRYRIITLTNSFHGRSMATLSATGQPTMHTAFQPILSGFSYATANDIDSVYALVDSHTCAIMLELVQGEGGVVPLEKSFVQAAERLCKANDMALIIDEVQTGVGRSGSLYAFQQFGISPDIVTSAKGLGGGLPIGATLLGARVKNTLTVGSHGSTFGANPVVCAGALSVLERIDDKLLTEITAKSELVKATLSTCSKVKSVTGLGLMLGVEVVGDASEIRQKLQDKGLLVLTAKKKLRLLPALNIPTELLESGLQIIKEILK
ncbi:MAG: acetylornithine/succinylornithine family transaminase [Clostridia bacterium]